MALTTERIRELYQEVQRRAAQLDAAGQYSFGGWFPIAVELVEAEVRKDDEALIAQMLDHIERNTCTHEETHRGGVIWEICDGCGAKWADDEGGKPPFAWPKVVLAARARLEKAP